MVRNFCFHARRRGLAAVLVVLLPHAMVVVMWGALALNQTQGPSLVPAPARMLMLAAKPLERQGPRIPWLLSPSRN